MPTVSRNRAASSPIPFNGSSPPVPPVDSSPSPLDTLALSSDPWADCLSGALANPDGVRFGWLDPALMLLDYSPRP